jgi:phospholipid/cholesterol/gamma-HCH transport system substrate-binding protein
MSVEARVGILALVATGVLIVSLLFLSGGINLRSRGYLIYVETSNAGGMADGAPVQMSGIDIGSVIRRDLTFDKKARLTLRIRSDVTIPADSRFIIGTQGLLGDRFITIAPGSADALIQPGETITSAEPFSIEALAGKVVVLAERAEEALVNINRLVGDPQLTENLRQSSRSAREASVAMQRIAQTVEHTTRVLDRSISADVPAIGAQLRAAASELVDAASEARGMVRDVEAGGATAQQIRSTVASMERAASGIEKMVRDLQGVVNEDQLRSIRASLDEVRGALADARSGINEARGGINEVRQAVSEGRAAISEGRAVVARMDRVVEKVEKIIPERLELPTLRNVASLEYSAWYDGQRLAQDITLTLLPGQSRNFIFTLREIGSANRVGVQVGQRLDDRFRARFGLINSYLGVGLDYRATQSLTYSMDVYNLNRVTLDAYLRYELGADYGLTLRAQSIFNAGTLGVGFFRRF